MANERILFGGVDITDAITPKEQVPAGVSLDDLDNLLAENAEAISNSENRLRTLLANQRERYTYPKIDIGFLSVPSHTLVRGREVQVPKFPVFKFLKSEKFGIRIGDLFSQRGLFKESKFFVSAYPYYEINQAGSHPYCPYHGVMRHNLLQSIGFKKTDYSGEFWSSIKIDEKMYKSLEPFNHEIFSISLDCLFPKETKDKISSARRLFNEDNLYITAEAKPKDWFNGFIPEKAMIFGTHDDSEFYLVDMFSPVRLDDKIPKERINDAVRRTGAILKR